MAGLSFEEGLSAEDIFLVGALCILGESNTLSSKSSAEKSSLRRTEEAIPARAGEDIGFRLAGL